MTRSTFFCRRPGFTMVEILLAIILISLALLGTLVTIQGTHRGSMDAYFEGVALSLVEESLEVYRGMGGRWLEDVLKGNVGNDHPVLKACAVNTWVSLKNSPPDMYPVDARFFRRLISVSRIAARDGIQGWEIRVTVEPDRLSRVEAWLSRARVEGRTVIWERQQ
jgi:prepilin-type N-terminal cleavage/methylation domain-containing protein